MHALDEQQIRVADGRGCAGPCLVFLPGYEAIGRELYTLSALSYWKALTEGRHAELGRRDGWDAARATVRCGRISPYTQRLWLSGN